MTTSDPALKRVNLPIKLRVAKQEDLPRLEWYGQYKHYRNLYRRTFREQQAGRRLMLLADCNGFPIGQIFIQFKGTSDTVANGEDRAYLYAFRVMEMFRGEGIGSWLVQAAEGIARKRGFSMTTIAVAKDNTRARRLYERMGYVIYGDDPGRWSYLDHRGRIRRVHEPCWLLEKNLVLG